ncbi:D-Ala-teichoic acid biosynthesis protein [Pilibacter termitis]|uniref:D-Ala-teichoic acid biosynthesis protein n=1 Tax=Pilibacter termitis TaxID=263852 RepID=A0A1T4M6T2_9ENTE|nr:teichoic acid D-Ala incorporation-associated protein DltX [Pilibacter termitis]SJZ62611.1 D-Ala-teichoic acid biosynthesis protein [Pilibacter termitis]
MKFLQNEWVKFTLKTIFYAGILLLLLYFYHFRNAGGGNFIYNEF